MDKHKLANDLRQRQYAYGLAPRHMIDALSEDEIIDTHITCSDCGGKQVDEKQLVVAITAAMDTNQFFDICAGISRGHGCG